MNGKNEKKTIRSPEDLPESLAEWSDEELGNGIKRAHLAGSPVLGLSYVRERHRRLGLYAPPEDKAKDNADLLKKIERIKEQARERKRQ